MDLKQKKVLSWETPPPLPTSQLVGPLEDEQPTFFVIILESLKQGYLGPVFGRLDSRINWVRYTFTLALFSDQHWTTDQGFQKPGPGPGVWKLWSREYFRGLARGGQWGQLPPPIRTSSPPPLEVGLFAYFMDLLGILLLCCPSSKLPCPRVIPLWQSPGYATGIFQRIFTTAQLNRPISSGSVYYRQFYNCTDWDFQLHIFIYNCTTMALLHARINPALIRRSNLILGSVAMGYV